MSDRPNFELLMAGPAELVPTVGILALQMLGKLELRARHVHQVVTFRTSDLHRERLESQVEVLVNFRPSELEPFQHFDGESFVKAVRPHTNIETGTPTLWIQSLLETARRA